MKALAHAAKDPEYPAEISLVISNNPEALGLQKASDMDIAIIAMDHKSFSHREGFDRALQRHLTQHNIDLICCAGFMRILSPWFVKQWPDRILNIHPSLLPKHKGLNTYARALKANDPEHGCSVHFVNEELDAGAVIAQAKFAIKADDTVDSLTEKTQELEHPLYVKALREVAQSLKESLQD